MANLTNADLKPYTVCEDDQRRQVVITRVDDRLVEYGYANQASVYYLEKSNFIRSFKKAEPRNLNASERRSLLTNLENCLKDLKSRGLADHVYAVMEEMGL